MSDPFRWPALAGAGSLVGESIHGEIGIWGKVHRQASDYRWIARSSGFGGQSAELHRRLRIGNEDRAARATAWRAPWDEGARDFFAIGTYPSRAVDAAGRSAVLEKQVLHWRRPSLDFPVALAALMLLPGVARADDRTWWDRVDEGDWQRADYALPLGQGACPRLRIERAGMESVIDAGIDALAEMLDQPLLSALYAGLLAGVRPVMVQGLALPLPPTALATLLLPLTRGQAERLSLGAWVPSMLVDPKDLGANWDLVVVQQAGAARVPDLAATPEQVDRGGALAEALLNRDPTRLGLAIDSPQSARGPTTEFEPARLPRDGVHGHPDRRMHLEVPSPEVCVQPPLPGPPPRRGREIGGTSTQRFPLPSREGARGRGGERPPRGLRYLYEFADRIDPRRIDLSKLAQDLSSPDAYPLLKAGEDPAGHALVGWIDTLTAARPEGVDVPEWGVKIDQLRAAALFLLPHPRTLDLVGLPEHPRVPALLAVLACDPGLVAGHLAAHGEPALRRMLAHSLACPDQPLVDDIRQWMCLWLSESGNPELEHALGGLL